MKAVTVDPDSNLKVIELPIPKYNEHQALVKLISCGICGTDQSLINKKFKGFDEEDYPLVLGHEGVGEVVEVGKAVKNLQVGDIVLLPFNDSSGVQVDGIEFAWGAMAEYGVVNDSSLIGTTNCPEVTYAQQVVPESINAEDAAMLVTLREVYSAIRYFGVGKDQSIVVIGSGPVAQTFVKILHLMGNEQVVAVVRNEHKEKILYECGATTVIHTGETDLEEAVKQFYPNGVSYVLDAVGSADIINSAMKLIKDRGEILCYGVPTINHMELDWTHAPYNWKLNFQQMPSKKEEGDALEPIVEWIEAGKLDIKDFISDYYHFSDVIKAFEDYLDGKVIKKAIITF